MEYRANSLLAEDNTVQTNRGPVKQTDGEQNSGGGWRGRILAPGGGVGPREPTRVDSINIIW